MTKSELFDQIITRYHQLSPPIRTKTYRDLAKNFRKDILSLSIQDVFALCEDLLQQDLRGATILAYQLLDFNHKRFERNHMAILDHLVRTYIKDWWDCDDLMTHAMMRFFLKYPDSWDVILKWTTDSNFAVRRCAAVVLVVPARTGLVAIDRITEVCDILFDDSHYLVQKGYGWLLKEASKSYQSDVINYIETHVQTMPRTAFRYALEKLPKREKERLMSL